MNDETKAKWRAKLTSKWCPGMLRSNGNPVVTVDDALTLLIEYGEEVRLSELERFKGWLATAMDGLALTTKKGTEK